MFTGIITDVGEVIMNEPRGERRRLRVASHYEAASIPLGGSICCDGVCLTVVEAARQGNRTMIDFDVAAETLAVTTLGALAPGAKINLERSLRVGDELGGHMVSGHVDGMAQLIARRDFDGMAHLRFKAPAALAKFIALKGSVALAGTSLTVNAVDGDAFEVLLIPHTLAETSWSQTKIGDWVNIEVDQMARYAARLMETGAV